MTTYLHNDKEKFYETMMFAYNQTNFPYEALERLLCNDVVETVV